MIIYKTLIFLPYDKEISDINSYLCKEKPINYITMESISSGNNSLTIFELEVRYKSFRSQLTNSNPKTNAIHIIGLSPYKYESINLEKLEDYYINLNLIPQNSIFRIRVIDNTDYISLYEKSIQYIQHRCLLDSL